MISHHCREISHWLPLAQTKKKKGNKVTRRLKTDRPPYMIASFHGLETVLRKSLKQQSWKRNVPSDTSRIFTEGNWRHLFKSLADKMAQNNSELDRMSETQAAQSDASNTNVNDFRKMSLQMVKSGLMDVPLKQKCAQRKMKWKGHIFKKGKKSVPLHYAPKYLYVGAREAKLRPNMSELSVTADFQLEPQAMLVSIKTSIFLFLCTFLMFT